jgi:hypothetical protein
LIRTNKEEVEEKRKARDHTINQVKGRDEKGKTGAKRGKMKR